MQIRPADSSEDSHKVQDKQTLKALSDARAANWPNTIQAQRARKERSKAEKFEVEERQRRKIDKIEADIKAESRRLQIERANKMLYDDSSRVKAFHSSLMTSDVMLEREAQIAYKHAIEIKKKKREEVFLKKQRKALEIAEEAEFRKMEERRQKALVQRDQQLVQLEQVRQKIMRAKKANREEGLLLKQQAMDEQVAAEEKARKRRQVNIDMAMATAKANTALKAMKRAEAQRQKDADDAIAAFARKKEGRILERKRREEMKQQKKQEQRNKMIAYMEEEVLKRRSDQDARLNQQQQEAQDKEDQAFADKAEKRRQEQIATNRSRQQQLDIRQRQKEADQAADLRFRELWTQRTKELKQEEEDETRLTFLENKKHQNFLIKQMHFKAQKKEAALKRGLEEAMLMKAAMERDEHMFSQYAKVCMDEWEAKGKSTVPIKLELNRKLTLG